MNRMLLSDCISAWAEQHRDDAAKFASQLVQIESINRPPTGNELNYQRYLAKWMSESGAEIDMYELDEVPGLREHPAYFMGRKYTDRPNTVGRFFSNKSGRTLLFSGHADTVYEGKKRWVYPPFAGHITGDKLYGLGAYDMKGGMAAALMAIKCLQDLQVPIAGSVYVESVVDEEYGGANGTLAGRLRGPHADMAIIPEPSNLKICPAHLGGGMWKASFAGKGGAGYAGEELVSALEATVQFALMLKDYDIYRKRHLVPQKWWKDGRKAEIMLLSISSGVVNLELQGELPSEGETSFWIEGYPGMTEEATIENLKLFYTTQKDRYPLLQKCKPDICPLIRYLSASEMNMDGYGAEFLQTVANAGNIVLGKPVDPPTGTPFACDGFMFNLYSHTPALILGPSGGNAHSADEFLDLKSYEYLIRWYAEIIVDWCGTE